MRLPYRRNIPTFEQTKFPVMIKLLIYEDNPQLREGLTMLINGSDGFEVLAAFKNCNTVIDELNAWKPDVILMDIDMPGINGIEGLKKIRQVNDEVKILMLTVFDDNKNVFQAISNGASGYILKKTPPSRLLEYIAEAQSGGAPMTASIATQVLKMFSSMNNEKGEDYNLSDREKQVLQFLVEGYSYKMIAAEMFIAIDTVRSHIKKIYEKLHVNSKSEAVAKAFKDKLL
jgi:DNA-binding NarL/FixJ family response regulator